MAWKRPRVRVPLAPLGQDLARWHRRGGTGEAAPTTDQAPATSVESGLRPSRGGARPTTAVRARSSAGPRRPARAPRSRRSRAGPTATSRGPRCAAAAARRRRPPAASTSSATDLHLPGVAAAGDHEVAGDGQHLAHVEHDRLLVGLAGRRPGRGQHPADQLVGARPARSATGVAALSHRWSQSTTWTPAVGSWARSVVLIASGLPERVRAEHHGDVDRVVGARVDDDRSDPERVAQLLGGGALGSRRPR